MSMIVGTCSMNTGHSYMQAPQVTQSQIGSKPPSSTSGVGCSGRWVAGDTAGTCSSSRCRMSTITSLGESSLPVRLAGQAAVPRPHSVPGDQPQDDPGVPVQGQALRSPDEALPRGHQRSHDDQDVERVHHGPQAVVDRAEDLFQTDAVVDAVEEEVQGAHLEDYEPPPDHRVEEAGVPVAGPGHARVADQPGALAR